MRTNHSTTSGFLGSVLLSLLIFAARAGASTKPCEDCIFTGTATLKVMGTTNHETISLKFNETGNTLYCKGSGDTSHTVTFDWCGPLKYDISLSKSKLVLHLEESSWQGAECAVRHHLHRKMRKLRMEFDASATSPPRVIKMTAQVYTVWPLGWKKTTWILKQEMEQRGGDGVTSSSSSRHSEKLK